MPERGAATDPVAVKICGLSEPVSLRAAIDAGARYVGLVFFPPSPRYLELQAAADLCSDIPSRVSKVGLVVDPTDAELDTLLAAVPLDILQLQGAESPARVAQVKARYGLPVMKAVGVAEAGDLRAVESYAQVADQLLIDAKPPKGSDLPGGNGVSFDWNLLTALSIPVPWLLAGGLNASNVAEAIRRTGARQVDVSSGVETSKGVKGPQLIRAFVEAAHAPLVTADHSV